MPTLKPSKSIVSGSGPAPSLRDVARDPHLAPRMSESLRGVVSFLSARAVLREAPELVTIERLIEDPSFVPDGSLVQFALIHEVPEEGVLAIIARTAVHAMLLQTVINTARAMGYHFVVEQLSPPVVPGGG